MLRTPEKKKSIEELIKDGHLPEVFSRAEMVGEPLVSPPKLPVFFGAYFTTGPSGYQQKYDGGDNPSHPGANLSR